MKHLGTQPLETPRLLLRRFRTGDAQAMFENWANDPAVTQFLRWPPHSDVTVSQALIDGWVRSYEQPDVYLWAIVLKSLGRPVGSISVTEMNEEVSCLDIGYAIGRQWWRQGIATEAFRTVIPFLFDEVGALRIQAQHDPNNPHSGAVMRKCGLRYEGTLRQADVNNRGIVDSAVYSLLKTEWEASRAGA